MMTIDTFFVGSGRSPSAAVVMASNPKFEYRNPKQIQNPKSETEKDGGGGASIPATMEPLTIHEFDRPVARGERPPSVLPFPVLSIRYSSLFRIGLHALRALGDCGVAAIPKCEFRACAARGMEAAA
jgi:hypothetical protein